MRFLINCRASCRFGMHRNADAYCGITCNLAIRFARDSLETKLLRSLREGKHSLQNQYNTN